MPNQEAAESSYKSIYIDSSVITDWFFLKSLKNPKKAGKNVIFSYDAMEKIAKKRIPITVSILVLDELANNLGKAIVRKKLYHDGVEFNYLREEDVKTEYSLTSDERDYLLNQIDELSQLKNIKILEQYDNSSALYSIIKLGLDTCDSMHIGYAVFGKCYYLLARDRHFTGRRKEILEDTDIKVITPKEFLEIKEYN